MRYFKILEPLIESILKNLSHRHAYVRRNAVTCVYSIVKTFGPDVIPQASVEIEQLLLVEGDLSTKRIAFIMLLNCDIDRAIHYATSVEEQVTSLGDVFQLAILELIRKVAKTKPAHKARLMKIVFYLANASSPAVMFECAQILTKYGSSPSSAQIAGQSYVNLLNSQPANNVKLIVLERLEDMQRTHKNVIESLVMDIFRGLSCPALGVRQKIISLVSSVLTSRNVSDVVHLLRKEISKTNAPETIGADGNSEYRRVLIQTVQQASRQFPQFAESVVVSLADMLSTSDQQTAYDIISFLREIMATQLHDVIAEKLIQILPDLTQSRVARMALWLIGEFGSGPGSLRVVLDCLAPLPLTASGKLVDADVDKEGLKVVSVEETGVPDRTITTKTVVLADGTYASQAVYGNAPVVRKNSSGIRNSIRAGDVLLATTTGVVLAKLYLKSGQMVGPALQNEIMFALTCLAKVVKASVSFGGKEQLTRLMQCVRVVAGDAKLRAVCEREWSSDVTRESLTRLVQAESAMRLRSDTTPRVIESPSQSVVFRILKEKRELLSDPQLAAIDMAAAGKDVNEESNDSIPGTLSSAITKDSVGLFSQRLAKASPMTGLADPVYIEGFLRLQSYDLILELTIANRTTETLQNILVELCTHGDLKVLEKPIAVTLAAGESATVSATIKVSSTENGIIFGYVTYDKKSEKEWIVLNEIHADVLDYIKPNCAVQENAFKSMWQEFEWENKIVVNTNINSPEDFIALLCKHTNLSFVGTEDQIKAAKTLLRTSQFAAVNLYAKSIFDEDALANVSLERGGELVGTVRIRSRTQGIALSLGDKVNSVQREQKLRGG